MTAISGRPQEASAVSDISIPLTPAHIDVNSPAYHALRRTVQEYLKRFTGDEWTPIGDGLGFTKAKDTLVPLSQQT